MTARDKFERELQQRFKATGDKHYAFEIDMLYLEEVLPPIHDTAAADYALFAAAQHAHETGATMPPCKPKSALEQLREMAECLGINLETDTDYCRRTCRYRLWKPAARGR